MEIMMEIGNNLLDCFGRFVLVININNDTPSQMWFSALCEVRKPIYLSGQLLFLKFLIMKGELTNVCWQYT